MKSLTKRYEEATPLIPRPRVIGKESGLIQLTFRKQLSFSRVFDLLLEKSDEDKLGKYPHLKFRLTWDEDKPVLLISFHEEEEQPLSLRINSVSPHPPDKGTSGRGGRLFSTSLTWTLSCRTTVTCQPISSTNTLWNTSSLMSKGVSITYLGMSPPFY